MTEKEILAVLALGMGLLAGIWLSLMFTTFYLQKILNRLKEMQ